MAACRLAEDSGRSRSTTRPRRWGSGRARPRSNRLSISGWSRSGLKPGAIEGEVGRRSRPLSPHPRRKAQPEAVRRPRATSVTWPRRSTARPSLNSAMQAPMHLHGQAVAVRVPEGADMAQEAGLLLHRQTLPNILQRGTQPVHDGLPRRAVLLRHLAGDARSPTSAPTRASSAAARSVAAPRPSAHAAAAIVRAARSP